MADITRIVDGLAEIVGREHVSADREEVQPFAVDGLVPMAVVFPGDTEQVAGVVRVANRENLSMVPWGSGSKMSMGNPPRRLDLVLSTSRMNRITDIDVANLTLTAQAGVRIKDIQETLASQEDRCYLPLEGPAKKSENPICSDRENKGSFLPIDAPFMDSATVGGILAANSSGPRRLLYGLPRDLVLGVRFVAPNGEIMGSGGKTVKNVSGFDISKLMIGSAGTLGILCEATLRLLPLPEEMETLLLTFPSLFEVSRFVEKVFELPLLPAAVEVMNRTALESLGPEVPISAPGDYVVAVALEGVSEAVARMRKELSQKGDSYGCSGSRQLKEGDHRALWSGVSNLASSLIARHPDLVSAQLVYPISHWKKIVEVSESTLSSAGMSRAVLAHAGSGVCLIHVLPEDAGKLSTALQALELLAGQCREVGGNLVLQRVPSGEKGKRSVWGRQGSDLVAMKWIKEKLDPAGLMSPGRFVGGL